MDDRTLLDRAAKAAGLRINFHPAASYQWNPLANDGDALRLEVARRFTVAVRPHEIEVFSEESGECLASIHTEGRDPLEATHRAIVRAAAAMGGE